MGSAEGTPMSLAAAPRSTPGGGGAQLPPGHAGAPVCGGRLEDGRLRGHWLAIWETLFHR